MPTADDYGIKATMTEEDTVGLVVSGAKDVENKISID